MGIPVGCEATNDFSDKVKRAIQRLEDETLLLEDETCGLLRCEASGVTASLPARLRAIEVELDAWGKLEMGTAEGDAEALVARIRAIVQHPCADPVCTKDSLKEEIEFCDAPDHGANRTPHILSLRSTNV